MIMKQFSSSSIVIFVLLVLNVVSFIIYFGLKNNNLMKNELKSLSLVEKNLKFTLNNQEKLLLEIDFQNGELNFNIEKEIKSSNNGSYKLINKFSKNINQVKSQEIKPNELEPKKTSDKLCPLIPSNLTGKLQVNTNVNDTTFGSIEKELEYLKIKSGGEWSPETCIARYKVGIIVPYRNRDANLKIFLRHMHPFLSKQLIDYGIYLVEPSENLTFNRGLLMNIGFIESLKITNDKWDCFMFHDVDLIPEDDRNIYSCPETPRHMSSAVSTFNYRLPYEAIFGGVSSLTKEQMKKVNGYSNLYFGWGGEDDDFRARIVNNGFSISRYPLEIGRYLMANHAKDQVANPKRFNLLNAASQRMAKEGLNSIEYIVTKIEKSSLFTRFYVSYDEKHLINKKI